MPFILEGIVTTLTEAGEVNVSPMGPILDSKREMDRMTLRPFQTSRTYRNLKQSEAGVFHVVDDVLLLARAAIGRWDSPPKCLPAEKIEGQVLESACRWYEFEVVHLDDREERTTIEVRVVHSGRLREFAGFNRAKHAVLELAILCTRLFLVSRAEAETERERLRVIVEKTAGDNERTAFDLLCEYLERYDSFAR